MIIAKVDQEQVVLQTALAKADGSKKTDIDSATVRVYHINDAGAEIEDLASTNLVQTAMTNVFRYIWEPGSLAQGDYIAEFTITDDEALTAVHLEDLSVGYLSDILETLQANITTILNVETGRWKIVNNQMIFYKPDNVTEVMRFNLFDINGAATMEAVTERVKV